MSNLLEGVELSAIYFPDGSVMKVGVNNITKLVVVMETGQMAMVPWVKVLRESKEITQYNCALLEGVEF